MTGRGRGFKGTGSRDPTGRAQVAELVDALASGASGLTAVKVRVLSWAPSFLKIEIFQPVIADASAAPAMPGGNDATLPRAMSR